MEGFEYSHIHETEKITHSPMTILVIRIIHEIPVLYDFSMRCVRNDVRSRCIWIRKVTIIHVHACEDIESINKHAIALLVIDECKNAIQNTPALTYLYRSQLQSVLPRGFQRRRKVGLAP